MTKDKALRLTKESIDKLTITQARALLKKYDCAQSFCLEEAVEALLYTDSFWPMYTRLLTRNDCD